MPAATTTSNRRRRTIGAVALSTAVGVGVVPLVVTPASASAGAAPATTIVTPDVGAAEAAIERLRERGLWVDAAADPTMTTAAVPGLASKFGKSLFEGVLKGGGTIGIEALYHLLGYSETDQALRDIGAAIDDLHVEMRAVSEKAEQLLDGQDRSNFCASYTSAGQAANRLSTAMASVGGWIDAGATPSAADVSDMQTIIRTAISDLTFTAANPTTGTVPLMMKAAEPSDTSDLADYWSGVDVVRDDHRAALAQGLLTLELLKGWDANGTVAADLATLTPIATDAVRAMYAFGVEATGPAGKPFVQLRNSSALSAWQANVPAADRDVWQATVDANVDLSKALRRDQVEPVLQQMAATWRPSLHGGKTLEEYLVERNVPHRVAYTDTITNHEFLRESGLLDRQYAYETRIVVGEINGNTYSSKTVVLEYLQRAWRKDWVPFKGWVTDWDMKATADKWASEKVAYWRTQAHQHSTAWQNKLGFWDSTRLGSYQAKLVIGTPDNGAGGFMVDRDPAKVAEAAFGTGV